MKCTIPEISWHNREPVLSVDIYPVFNDFYRMASGGGDCHVLIWQMTISDNGAVKQELVSDLTRHQRAVNCVRWSPSGQYLASADDDANIIIWQQKTDNIPLLEGETSDKEIWTHFKVLRGHKEDIYDVCWSSDSTKLFSGSIDNTAILWDIQKGKLDHILTDHKGFVQGVTWDPKNQVIASISTDRTCRIFDTAGKHVKARIWKGMVPVSPEHFLYEKEVKYFHDDTYKSFFRRLQFTPDGSLLIVPSGHMEADGCKNKALNATLVFTLDNLSRPAAILPLPTQSSTVVRCCPTLFELKENGPEPLVKLPYRMVFAVGTDHDIILYDTQQTVPFARFQDMHYTRLTDLAWSSDGLILVASSTDGFCTLVTFDMNEIGVPYTKDDTSEGEDNALEISGLEEVKVEDKTLEKDENLEINNKEEVKKRPSFLEQWAVKKPKLEKEKEDVKEAVIKKITPLKVEDFKKPAENVGNKHSDAKPIAVRRKPKEDPKNTNGNIEKPKETEEKSQNVEKVQKRIAPIKIGEADPDKYKARPIEVRRKPRNVQESSKMESDKVSDESQSSSETELKKIVLVSEIVEKEETKPDSTAKEQTQMEIEFTTTVAESGKPQSPRKSNNEGTEKEDKEQTSSEQQGNEEISIVEDNKEQCSSEQQNTENKDCKKQNSQISEEKKEKPADTVEVIDLDSNYSTAKQTPKSKKPVKRKLHTGTEESSPKIKVSSLVRKKFKPETPMQKNSLLSFLNRSTEKNKVEEKSKNLKTSEKKSKKQLILDPVDLTVEDNAVFGPLPINKNEESHPRSSKTELNVDEECTEDFTLQLEEESKSETIKEKSETENTDIESKVKDNSEKKTPRKVPFITLSSPKRMKLPKN